MIGLGVDAGGEQEKKAVLVVMILVRTLKFEHKLNEQ